MKKLFLLLLIIIHLSASSQTSLVQVIASGDGKTKDESLNAALRHCIEKTFGVFVSTNTTVSNDSLIKDDIATIASGNIVSYSTISELQKNDLFTTTVSAQVSPENVVKIMKGKGYEFELNGEVFAQNIMKEKFYQDQEVQAVNDFFKVWSNVQLFDFDIKIGEPLKGNVSSELYQPNSNNLSFFKEYLNKTFYEDKQKKLKYVYASTLGNTKEHEEDVKCYSSKLLFTNWKIFSETSSGIEPGNEYYYIPVLFIPKINNNYKAFVKSLINIFNSLSIKESVESYTKLNSDIFKFTIETPAYLDNFDLNTFKKYEFLLRNYWNFKPDDYIQRSTASAFIESNFINLRYSAMVMISETQNKISYDKKLIFCNYPTNISYGSQPKNQLLGEASTFDPSILLVRLTYDELKNLNKFDFKVKQPEPFFTQYLRRK